MAKSQTSVTNAVAVIAALSFVGWLALWPHPPLDNPKSTVDAGQVEHAMSQLDAARHDPAKQKIFECMGVKVYDDPQPQGHPPSKQECAVIMRRAESPPATQSFAQEERQTASGIYYRKRDQYLNGIRMAYFAVGCGVFASEAGVLPLISASGNELQQEATSQSPPIIDNEAQGLMRQAAHEGLERSKTQCQFWKDNPDALHTMVREAEIAAGQ